MASARHGNQTSNTLPERLYQIWPEPRDREAEAPESGGARGEFALAHPLIRSLVFLFLRRPTNISLQEAGAT